MDMPKEYVQGLKKLMDELTKEKKNTLACFEIVEPAECMPDCDDRMCPYSHFPVLRRIGDISPKRLN